MKYKTSKELKMRKVVFLPEELRFLVKNCRKENGMFIMQDKKSKVFLSLQDSVDCIHLDSDTVAYFARCQQFFCCCSSNRKTVRKDVMSFCLKRIALSNIKDSIIDSIIDCVGDANLVVSELKRYKRDFPLEADYNFYRFGNLFVYHEQIREFYLSCGYKKLPQSNLKLERDYMRDVRRVINQILA